MLDCQKLWHREKQLQTLPESSPKPAKTMLKLLFLCKPSRGAPRAEPAGAPAGQAHRLAASSRRRQGSAAAAAHVVSRAGPRTHDGAGDAAPSPRRRRRRRRGRRAHHGARRHDVDYKAVAADIAKIPSRATRTRARPSCGWPGTRRATTRSRRKTAGQGHRSASRRN